jgi:tetratricopeptide (TPR) repeat protein
MEKTPLEIYETAYKLHYVEKKIPEAVSYYEQLIKGFPDSNECGYAAIQLQKIKTGNLSETIRRTQNSVQPLAVISFIIACFSLLACGAVMYYSKEKLKVEQNRITLTTSALGKILRGEDDEALRLLTELKIVHKEDITPFELSADIYRRNHLFQKAKDEYELFFRLNPDRQPSKNELSLMESDADLSKPKSKKDSQKQELQNENDSIFDEFALVKEKTSDDNIELNDSKAVKKNTPVITQNPEQKIQTSNNASSINNVSKKPKEKAQSTAAPVNGLFLVNPDSLSYF